MHRQATPARDRPPRHRHCTRSRLPARPSTAPFTAPVIAPVTAPVIAPVIALLVIAPVIALVTVVAAALVMPPVAAAHPGAAAGDASSTDEYAFVLTTDYFSAAEYVTIDLTPPRPVWHSPQPPSTDAVGHYDADQQMVFIVNRFLFDNIQLVDPAQGFATVGQYSVGNGSNPQDIRLVSGEKAYVSRFEWTTLAIVHPYLGTALGTIDLAPLADADGIPEMTRMELVGDRLFVVLARIDHTTWQPVGPGRVAVIDTRTDTLIDVDPATPGVQAISLELANPYSELRYDPVGHRLVIGCIGVWGVLDGGVEAIDVDQLTSGGVIASEAELGGDVSDALIGPDGRLFAVIMDPAPWPDNFARLVEFDPASGTVTATLHQQSGGLGSELAGIEIDNQGELFLCDRDATQPGMRIYDAATHAPLAFIDVGLPPHDVLFVQPRRIAVGGTVPAPSPGRLGQNLPNPFNPTTRIPFTLARAAQVTLDVIDAGGRRVARLLDRRLPAGEHAIRWDGFGDDGAPAASGTYFYRLVTGERMSDSRKLTLVR